jgi:hypothetical protein
MTLGGDGSLDLGSLTNGNLGGSVTQYQATASEFLTSALDGSRCSGLGHYTWARSGSSLTLVVINDPCALRVAILSSHAWRTA